MPVTAKLSRKFYETFGDEIANDLVEWFNRVDAAYRFEFRDLFEVHFARFDAKLAQGLAEVKAELRADFQSGLATLRGELYQLIATTRTEAATNLTSTRASLIKWMFGFWAGNVIATAGLVLAAVALLRH